MKLASAKLWRALAALLCGAVVPLGFAPFGWFAIPVLSLAALVLLLYSASPRAALVCGWLFGVGQFGVGVSWVYISIYLYGNAGLGLSIAVMLLLVAFLALYPALMAWVAAKARVRSHTWYALGLFPAAWMLSEWLRSWVFTGFPWLNLGYSQVDSSLLGFAPLLGAYGVGWLTALSAGLIAWALRGAMTARIAGVALLALMWLGGAVLNQVYWTETAGKPLTASLVQGNIPQDLKWRPEQQQATLQRYVELSRRQQDTDLLVWPETAVPAFYDQVVEDFLEPLRVDMKSRGIALVTGIPVLDRAHWQYFNAVISLEELERFYYKVHLVPFGEYLPLRDWLARVLSFLPVPESDFSSGNLHQPLLRAAGYPIGASICYEIAFGEQLIAALPEAAFLVNVSNDAWFGDSLAPHQHLEMARMRARETERYVLRATNTGISAIIDAGGELVTRSRQFETEVISAPVEPRAGATPYVRGGNWPILLICLFALLSAWGFGRRKP